MSALYAMRYVGQSSTGAGALYVGKGKIVGVDVGGGYYNGTYRDENGRLKGTVTLSAPRGATLVTGQPMAPGSSLQLSADWPADFANGQAQTIMVAGRPVQVTFEKIGDVP